MWREGQSMVGQKSRYREDGGRGKIRVRKANFYEEEDRN